MNTEPAPNLDVICALCGKRRGVHSCLNEFCPAFEDGEGTWKDSCFKPAQPDARLLAILNRTDAEERK